MITIEEFNISECIINFNTKSFDFIIYTSTGSETIDIIRTTKMLCLNHKFV